MRRLPDSVGVAHRCGTDTAQGRACGPSACVLCYVLANLLLCVPVVRRVL
jgi:hypothetical protein